jgi:hypothetical protein
MRVRARLTWMRWTSEGIFVRTSNAASTAKQKNTDVKQKPIRVGITAAHAKDVPSVLWSNGINQNVVYLALLMQKLSGVEVSLVAYPFGELPTHPLSACFKVPTINTFEDALKLDIIVELGIRLEADFTKPYRDKGGKLVNYMAGNSMVMNAESLFLEGEPALRGSAIGPDNFDAVWITPQHMHMNAGVSGMLSGPVEEAPHIWAPAAIEHAIASLGIAPAFSKRPETWSLGTFDPNINVVKSFHIPLLVAESAHRNKPEQIRRMMLFCTEHLKGRNHFETFIAKTSLGKANKVTSEARHGIASMLGREVDCVITHQWENDLNYMYWDVLSLGYPLVHNSSRIKDAGYYYHDFDPVNGGEALLEALAKHDGPRDCDVETVWRFHVGNEANQKRYKELLNNLLDS